MRLDGSTDALNISRSESVTDLNSELLGGLHSRSAFRKDTEGVPTKQFGLGRLISVLYALRYIIGVFRARFSIEHCIKVFCIIEEFNRTPSRGKQT